MKSDEDALNTFLKTLVIIEEGETLSAYSRFALLRPDPQEWAAKLCADADGLPLKILKKNLTAISQTWSVPSFSNLVPTSYTSDITLDRAKLIYGIIQRMDMNVGYLISHQIFMITQHDSSRLGFPSLITALRKARGVTSDSRTLESLGPAINLAYVKKNCWNLDDLIVTFRGPRKAKGKKSETLPSSEVPSTILVFSTSAPASSTPATSTPSPVHLPVLAHSSSGPSNFSFTPKMLHATMQSLHQGQVIIMQSFQSLGLPSIMSVDEFLSKVAWLGVQPSPFGGGGTSATQELEPIEEHAPAVEDELTPPEPFSFTSDSVVAQEEVPSPELIPEPSPTPISEDTLPSAPALEQEQPISQAPPAALVLDLNEHADDHPQED